MKENIKKEGELFKRFWQLQIHFLSQAGRIFWGWSDWIKGGAAKLMYRQRGRFSQTFVNVSMALLFFGAIVFSGKVDNLINNSRNDSSGRKQLPDFGTK